MTLANFITHLPLPVRPGRSWAVAGPEAAAGAAWLNGSVAYQERDWPYPGLLAAEFDDLLLAGALSAGPEPFSWLGPVLVKMSEGALLLAVDWQADGALDVGPDYELRLKRGRLRRLLREAGFGLTAVAANHHLYYLVRGEKGPPPLLPHAGEFVAVAHLDELPRNTMKRVDLFGQPIVVANTGREIVAFAATCPHSGYPLDRGKLRGRLVVCRSHGYIWNVWTGEPDEPPDEDTLPRYQVRVDTATGQVWVALAAPLP